MGQALYRKYRSKSLAEIVGQEHITDTLSRALKTDRISHAYLFSGPRGVGKTSIARILAHEINGLPYDETANHLDIIEIDAASNNGVEDVRELREKVYVTPTSSAYKVYIIDEVHMLSKAAFNALLKTLEEPPAHAVFILATTEAHKLPETIISRTQHFTFKPVAQAKVVEHLKHIAAEENVAIDDDALALLAGYGEGSFRDSISVLDQVQGLGSLGDQARPVGVDDVRHMLGIASEEAIVSLVNAITTGADPAELLHQTSDLYAQGLQAAAIAGQLAEKLRGGLLGNQLVLPADTTLALLRQLIDVQASRSPERYLEIILLDTAGSLQSSGITTPDGPPETTQPTKRPVVAAAKPQPAQDKKPVAASVAPAPPTATAPKPEPAVQPKAAADKKPSAAPAGPLTVVPLDAAAWSQVLDGIKKQYNTIYGVLRMATPVFSEQSVELQFKFAFHQKRLNETKNRQIIADFIKQVTGQDIDVSCIYVKDENSTKQADDALHQTNPASSVDAISNIFGGAEVI